MPPPLGRPVHDRHVFFRTGTQNLERPSLRGVLDATPHLLLGTLDDLLKVLVLVLPPLPGGCPAHRRERIPSIEPGTDIRAPSPQNPRSGASYCVPPVKIFRARGARRTHTLVVQDGSNRLPVSSVAGDTSPSCFDRHDAMLQDKSVIDVAFIERKIVQEITLPLDSRRRALELHCSAKIPLETRAANDVEQIRKAINQGKHVMSTPAHKARASSGMTTRNPAATTSQYAASINTTRQLAARNRRRNPRARFLVLRPARATNGHIA